MPAINRPFYSRFNTEDHKPRAAGGLDRNTASDYRRHVGLHLREARLGLGLTQSDVGDMVGVGYTTISAIEVGNSSVPPDRYEDMAKALEIPAKEFGELMFRYSNPWAWGMIHGFTPQLRKELGLLHTRQGPHQIATAGRRAP